MITFSKLGEYGRLGNQLFQYAAAKALSLENGYNLILPNPSTKNWHGQDCLLKNFSIPEALFGEASGIQYAYLEQDAFQYDPSFWQALDNTDLVGFFQSMSYFEKHSDVIKKDLLPKDSLMEEATNFVSNIREKYNKPVVSIHIRRGDNATVNKEHYKDMYSAGSPYFSYLKNAVNLFSDCTLLVFTGGKRSEDCNGEDIEWCKNNLGLLAEYSRGNTLQDFCRMMVCDHSILSPATSFGWWAGYLSVSKDKKVVAPIDYHPDIKGFNHRENFYPEEFILCD
jgi:hypothetical protein